MTRILRWMPSTKARVMEMILSVLEQTQHATKKEQQNVEMQCVVSSEQVAIATAKYRIAEAQRENAESQLQCQVEMERQKFEDANA